MMGADCERIVKAIHELRRILDSEATGIGGTLSNIKEEPVNAASYVNSVQSAYSSLSNDISKVAALGSNMYTSTDNFNNSCGSPWTELSNLKNAVEKAISYGESHGVMTLDSQKMHMSGLLRDAASEAIDAKWAMITYNDYIQRGYDAKYNNNTPSITFKTGGNKESTGNIKQTFDENVNVKEPSIDPF